MQRHEYFSILCLIVFAAPSFADVQEFENEQRPEFFTAIGGSANVTTIGFSIFPSGTPITDQYRHLGVTFDGINNTIGPSPSFVDEWGFDIISGNDLYFEEPINWIAADFLGTLQIELYDGDELFYTSTLLGSSGLGQFGGLVSSQSFDRVRIFDPLDPFAVLDDLHFGPPINVPAPGVLAIVGMVLVSRRRRRKCGSRGPMPLPFP